MIFKARDKYFDLDKKPLIMGILNMTPDSFSDGGNFLESDKALFQCERMIREGADIIDIGGESSRPGSKPVSSQEELDRILKMLHTLKLNFDICISADTYKPEVARSALIEGAGMINNIFGIKNDPDMLKTVSEFKAGYCIMHIKGIPGMMQKDTEYEDIMSEILSGLKSSVKTAENAGVSREYIAIDPGIGFGKDMEGNLKILKNLRSFAELHLPVLIGTSRKSFIGKILNEESEGRLFGTIASNVAALINGALIFRVHDVKENRQAIDTAFAIMNSGK
jgi:dihydropteroate synthase